MKYSHSKYRQSPYKIADVLQKRCSYKFRNIHRKRPVLVSLFDKVAGLKVCNFIKTRIQHRCFPVNIAKFLRKQFFFKTPLVAAPEEELLNCSSRIMYFNECL